MLPPFIIDQIRRREEEESRRQEYEQPAARAAGRRLSARPEAAHVTSTNKTASAA
ncbi:MAG: hypothetical protein QM756_30810 [Polyangiaceae bacterium]